MIPPPTISVVAAAGEGVELESDFSSAALEKTVVEIVTRELSGYSTGTSTATGNLTDFTLTGYSTGTSTATGNLTGLGSLSGFSTGSSTATATFSNSPSGTLALQSDDDLWYAVSMSTDVDAVPPETTTAVDQTPTTPGVSAHLVLNFSGSAYIVKLATDVDGTTIVVDQTPTLETGVNSVPVLSDDGNHYSLLLDVDDFGNVTTAVDQTPL